MADPIPVAATAEWKLAIPVAAAEWQLAYHFREIGGIVLDRREELNIESRLRGMEAKREYTTRLTGRPYRIFTKNTERRAGIGHAWFGPYKHAEADPWSDKLDWGTQADLRGTMFDMSHGCSSGKGVGDWQHGCSPERATLRSDDYNIFQAQTYTSAMAGWPHLCVSGGLIDGLEGAIAAGSAGDTRFAVVGPEGQVKTSNYTATMPVAEVTIYVRWS